MEKKLFEIYETDTKPVYNSDEWYTLDGKCYSIYDFTKNKYLVCYRNDDYKQDEMIENLIKENQRLSKKINHLLDELKELKEEDKFQEIPLFEGTMEQLDNLTILKEEGKNE